MRILKIELTNYRGVRHRVVEFAPGGVTVVEGPNEIGKSSIAEAIDRIIEDMDSTSKQRVQAVKPVDQDVGPEVMIEAEAGPYAFTYRKRFLRDRITELEVTRPRPENHTGREAHDRVTAILAETVDMALWKALRMQQGDVVGQAPLDAQTSLSAALDRSAGESPAGDDELSLFEAAHAEYLQYWTETGRRKQAVAIIEERIEQAASKIVRTDEAIRAIEADVEMSVRLDLEVKRLVEGDAEQRQRLAQHQERVDALARLEAGLEAIQARLDGAQLTAKEAVRVAKERMDAIAAIAVAGEARETIDASAREDQPQLQTAQERVQAADDVMAKARAARDAAKALADERGAQLSRLRDVADLAALVDREGRARTALAAIEAAAPGAAIPVDAARLAAIRAGHRAAELARARLETARPLVELEALADVDGTIDGLALHLPAGTRLERRVDRSLELVLADALTLSVVVGAAGDASDAELVAAEGRLADLLRDAGARDLADAERLSVAREDAVRTLADQRRALRDSLGDLTADALAERIATLRGRLAAAAAEVPAAPAARATRGARPGGAAAADVANDEAGARDEDELRRSTEAARLALGDAERAVQAAETEWEAARRRLAEIELAHGQRAVELRLADEEVRRCEAVLAGARAAASDEAVAVGLATAERALADLRTQLADARDQLAREGLDQARETLTNAKRVLDGRDANLRQVQDELLQVTTRLRDHGEDGLSEDLQEAQADKDQAEQELLQYQSRAEARKLLFETLKSEREAARRSYVAPLRREIEVLGKIVFGPDFAVDLNELTLSVVSRTLQGRTIPFDSLSIGTQEQIALISRLACATIVAPDGGVPVILDDALGNSDPQRLEAMGAVLAVAGRQSQIIVLTCQPDRYEHVGGARVVRLS